MRVRILGAGIIGLACADELVRRGHSVSLVDPSPGQGASHAAAGMLSPASELWHGETEVFDLGRRSLALWPAFAARLGVHLEERGTLLAAVDAGDLQEVDRRLKLLTDLGVAAQPLTGPELLGLEPGLGVVSGGALLPDDQSVDPRAVTATLLRKFDGLVEVSAVEVATNPSDFAGFDATVIATGARLPEPFAHLVRPVRGEIIRVRSDDPPARTVRGWVRGEEVYAVPRQGRDGPAEVVIGATSEEHDAPPIATVGGVSRLLDAVRELLPALERAEQVEAIARDRPATADHLPLIGPTEVDGVVLAAGHYRHGVLLAPLTAQLVADHLETGLVEPAVDPRRRPAC
jgi:glycine oxidase